MEQDIINKEDYKVKVKKTWVTATDVWHIEFQSQSVYDYRFELFLTDNELEHLRRIL
tara:strand:- start:1803 stop:1973 length:171 start_codon:yes stop_codon:yes gene_type:complete